MSEKTPPKYDVALSFAGEQRHYVAEVARILGEQGVRVFYDRFEEIELWGEELGEALDTVYRKESAYVVVFISSDYKEKIWTTHELRSALSAAIEERSSRVLPARFDNTDLPGLRPTVGYLSLEGVSSAELAEKIYSKIRPGNFHRSQTKKHRLMHPENRLDPLPGPFEIYCVISFGIEVLDSLERHYEQFGHINVEIDAFYGDEGGCTVQIFANPESVLPLREISMYDWSEALLAEDATQMFGPGEFVFWCSFNGRPCFLYERSSMDPLSFSKLACETALENIRAADFSIHLETLERDLEPYWLEYEGFRLVVYRLMQLGQSKILLECADRFRSTLGEKIRSAMAHFLAQGSGRVDHNYYNFPSGLQRGFDRLMESRSLALDLALEERLDLLESLNDGDRSVVGAIHILRDRLNGVDLRLVDE